MKIQTSELYNVEKSSLIGEASTTFIFFKIDIRKNGFRLGSKILKIQFCKQSFKTIKIICMDKIQNIPHNRCSLFFFFFYCAKGCLMNEEFWFNILEDKEIQSNGRKYIIKLHAGRKRILGRWQSRKHQEVVFPSRQKLHWQKLCNAIILECKSIETFRENQGGKLQFSLVSFSSQHSSSLHTAYGVRVGKKGPVLQISSISALNVDCYF